MKTSAVVIVGVVALLILAVPFFASLTAWELVLCGLTLIVVGGTSMVLGVKGLRRDDAEGRPGD